MYERKMLEQLKEIISQKFESELLDSHDGKDMPVLICQKDNIFDLLKFLRDHSDYQFNLLTDITAVDYLKHPQKKSERFEVVYLLYSLKFKYRLRIRVPLGFQDLTIDTVVPLWKTANWLEREVFDMFGIVFNGHPNLKRILTHIEFTGHALRKDYHIKKRQILTTNDPLVDEMEKRLIEKGLR